MYGSNYFGQQYFGQAAAGGLWILPVDSVTVTEDVNIQIYVPSSLYRYDEVSVTESVDIRIQTYVSVYDQVSASESVSEVIFNSLIVSDQVSVSENISSVVETFPRIEDAITVSENVVVKITFLTFSAFDSVIVSESVSSERKIYGYSLGIPQGDIYEVNTKFGGVL